MRPVFCSLLPLSLAVAGLLRPQLQYMQKHSSWSLQIYHSELRALSDLYKNTRGDISLLPQDSLGRQAQTQQALAMEDTTTGVLQP